MAHICIADSHARAGLLCASLARQAAAVRVRLRRSSSTSTSTKSDHFFAKVRAHKAVQRPYSPGEVRAPAFQLRVRAAKAYLTMSMAGQPRALWRKASVAALLAAKRMGAPLHTFRVHKSPFFACFAATTGTAQFSHPARVHEMR